MSNLDYAKQLEHLGKGMTDAEKQLAIINGIQNNIGGLLDWVQKLDARVMALEEKIDEIS
jgi:hypothetical protein